MAKTSHQVQNALRRDPTRTTVLRRQFMAEMNKRFRKIRGEVSRALITDDVLGLNLKKSTLFNASPGVQAFRFSSDPQKLISFREWFQERIDADVLTVEGSGKPWTAEYTTSAYRKGAMRAYTDVHKDTLSESPAWYKGTKEGFLNTAFAGPETVAKIQLIYLRAFEELKGVTAAMGQQISRILADGLAHGEGAYAIARKMNKAIGTITKTRALTIARTEIVRAHSEGQLDSFEKLGIKEVGMLAEWSTAADDRVCFPKGTMINTEFGETPIECVQIGDMVYTRLGLRKVLLTTKRPYYGRMVQLVTKGRPSLCCTKDHPIFVRGRGWIHAEHVRLGDYVSRFNEDPLWIKDVIFNNRPKRTVVYNLEVEGEHEYYAEGILVHNCDLCAPLDGIVMTVKEARGMIPRHPNCFVSPLVQIYTKDGWKPIVNVCVGEMVLTHKNRFRKVTQLHRNFGTNVDVVFLEVNYFGTIQGQILVLTQDHPVLVVRKHWTESSWVSAKDIVEDDKIAWLEDYRVSRQLDKISFGKCEVVEVSHECLSSTQLYNLSVEEDESYVADNCVVHNCRCAWIPANVGEKERGQKFSKAAIDRDIVKSLKAEHPKAPTARIARVLSKWVGKEKKISTKARKKQ